MRMSREEGMGEGTVVWVEAPEFRDVPLREASVAEAVDENEVSVEGRFTSGVMVDRSRSHASVVGSASGLRLRWRSPSPSMADSRLGLFDALPVR